MKGTSRRIIRTVAIASLGVFILAGIGAGCSRSFHRPPDPEKMQKYVMWKLNDRLDDLDATDQQRKAIVAAANKVMADALKMKAAHKNESQKYEILDELERGDADAEKYHRIMDEKFDQLKGFAHRTLDTLLQAFMELDQNQRKELLEEAREHMAEHQSS